MKKNKRIAVFDIEADGLNPTKIYCLSANFFIPGKGWKLKTVTDYGKMREFFEYCDIIVGHSITLYDIPVVEKLLEIKVDCKLVDTLGLSWKLFPDRNLHNLDSWGKELGIAKPKIDDWENLSIEEYMHRCEEDVKINTSLYLKFLALLKKIYSHKGDYKRDLNYVQAKMVALRKHIDNPWSVDMEKVIGTYDKFMNYIEECTARLRDSMPKVPNMAKIKKPNKRYKQSGEETVRYQKWVKMLEQEGYDVETYDKENLEYAKSYDEANPNSHKQIKDWLFSLGWKPETFDYKKDEKEPKGFRKVPQVKDGDELCKSVQILKEKEPAIKFLEDFSVANHRANILKGIIKNVSEEGTIPLSCHGFTNTMRLRHNILVNLPKPNWSGSWSDGEHIRGCLIAKEDHVLCGSDLSSLEDTTKQHYIYKYDPDYVEEMRVPGFDPHLDIGILAEVVSEEDAERFKQLKKKEEGGEELTGEELKFFRKIEEDRGFSKQVNFSATYGVGAKKLSRTTGRSLKFCEKLLETYWDRNRAVKAVARSQKVIEVDGMKWLWNPVSKMWYYLKYDKDVFSTLNQGTGAYVFDVWMNFVLSKIENMPWEYHDEFVLMLEDTEEKKEEVAEIINWAIKKTNKFLKLNVPIGADFKFGYNYAKIH